MIRRILIAVLLVIGTIVSVARADTVKYSTSFALGNPTDQTWLNNMALTFNGVTNNVVDTPAQASLGRFKITGWVGTDYFVNVPFDLTITQYLPLTADNTGTFTSFINGTISFNQSSATVAFQDPFISIGNVIYSLTQERYTLNADGGFFGSDPGYTDIQAQIVATTPEPSGLLLFGTGLLILAGVIRGAKRSRIAFQRLGT